MAAYSEHHGNTDISNASNLHFVSFKLNQIKYISGTQPCWVRSDAFEISQDAMKQILFENGLNTPCGKNLEPDSCATNFSFTWGACWHFTLSGPGGPEELEHCTWIKEICCFSNWLICLNSKGNPIYPPQKWHNFGINPQCPFDPEDPLDERCFGICEEETK